MMYRNWKKVSALGLAVLLGCTLPMGTMLAAEDKTETVQGTGENSLADELKEDADTSDKEGITVGGNPSGDEGSADKGNNSEDGGGADQGNPSEDGSSADKENPSGDANISDDENNAGDENLSGDVNISDGGDIQDEVNGESGNAGDETDAGNSPNGTDESIPQSKLPAIQQKAPGTEAAASIGAPEISITWQGRNLTSSPGGKISYEYINYNVKVFSFEVSASQGGNAVQLSYYLDKVSDMDDEAKETEDLEKLTAWASITSGNTIPLLNDGTYVLYVKAEGEDGQITYVRSCGIVGDTQAPKVIGVEEGKAYPEGTVFQIEDANLESVTINEKPVVLSADGSYQVVANGTSCVIKAKDKAGNQTVRSFSISGKDPAQDGNVISGSGIYALKKGISYHLAEGRWKTGSDNTVYAGGSDFYVKTDKDYMLIRY